ncbi:hypothetical protein BHM03_00046023 [Ensete ventricosum]|nr:hypothetical protein BHM03_00046023 [Ensete ventricosum]
MEEARDEAATTEDMAVESIVEGEQHIGALHHELKDAHWQLGKRRGVAFYKEFKRFQCNLQCSSQVAYEFGYEIATGRFKAKSPTSSGTKSPLDALRLGIQNSRGLVYGAFLRR